MWKILILLSFLCKSVTAIERNVHLRELKEQFPYALLTDDYGILSKNDLKINECIAEPSQFSENGSTFYPYWRCFELNNAKMLCEGRKYSGEDKSRMTMLVLTGAVSGELNRYISRRPMKLKSCHSFQRDWAKFVKNEKHVCISGDLIDSNVDKAGKKERTWIFDRYKTNKGCDSYFQGGCVLPDQQFCVTK